MRLTAQLRGGRGQWRSRSDRGRHNGRRGCSGQGSGQGGGLRGNEGGLGLDGVCRGLDLGFGGASAGHRVDVGHGERDGGREGGSRRGKRGDVGIQGINGCHKTVYSFCEMFKFSFGHGHNVTASGPTGKVGCLPQI